MSFPGLQANGADIRGGTWFETGAEMLNGGTLNYFAVPWGIINNPLPLVVVTLIEVGLLGAAENYRCAWCRHDGIHALPVSVSHHACVSATCVLLLHSEAAHVFKLCARNAGITQTFVHLASGVLSRSIWRSCNTGTHLQCLS